ncbi:MAG: ATP-binding cassette domain-containing protein [Lentisphaeria bacterium]|nr:ATP-binding cassette domain-containing protein [Lentisphaeria bacterium]
MRSPVERQDDKNSIFQPAILGDIEFQEVTFTYPDHNKPALNKVSFKIKAGEKVAIIGKIGSGKSTIQKLLMALYTPQDGKILIDGVDHNQIDVVDLRSNMGYIPQDANLFYGTIRENILLGAPNISEEQLHRALETSGLSKMINNESMGIDLPVGEQGRFLSGGQRQMVSAARGIANDTPIYLFDEPTTSLDTSSEAEFLRRVQPMLEPKTLILVTHKMHLLTLVDRVIVMDNGKIILDGAKEQILNQLSPKTENSKKTENSDNGEMTATFINPVTKAQSRRSKRTIEVKK